MAINPLDIIKQFGNMQEKMGEVQEKIRRISATGYAGGDMVQVELNGQMEVLKIHISREVVDPKDITMLEDLVRAAVSDALVKIKEKVREEVSSLTGGLNLPTGFMGL